GGGGAGAAARPHGADRVGRVAGGGRRAAAVEVDARVGAGRARRDEREGVVAGQALQRQRLDVGGVEDQPAVEGDLPRRADGEGVVGGGAVVDQRVAVARAVRRQGGATPQVLIADRQQAVDLEGAGLVVAGGGVDEDVGADGPDHAQAVVVGLAVVEQFLHGAEGDQRAEAGEVERPGVRGRRRVDRGLGGSARRFHHQPVAAGRVAGGGRAAVDGHVHVPPRVVRRRRPYPDGVAAAQGVDRQGRLVQEQDLLAGIDA